MSDKAIPSTPRRRLVASLSLAVLVVTAIGLFSTWSLRSRRNATSPIVGTWKTEERDRLLNFRADGTARARSNTPGGEIGYFEWVVEGNELWTYQYRSRNSLGAWIVRAKRATVGATPNDRYRIIESSPSQVKLQFTDDGTIYTLTPTEDRALESAP